MVQPNLFVVPLRSGRESVDWRECGIPILIAEALSRRTALNDRATKRRLHQRLRAREFWIVEVGTVATGRPAALAGYVHGATFASTARRTDGGSIAGDRYRSGSRAANIRCRAAALTRP